jgi:hypothetical protein
MFCVACTLADLAHLTGGLVLGFCQHDRCWSELGVDTVVLHQVAQAMHLLACS